MKRDDLIDLLKPEEGVRHQAEGALRLHLAGIKRPHDREMGIAGGELIVLDLETNEVLGVRRGYALHVGQWQVTPVCPKCGYEGGWDKFGHFTFWFVGKVLRPRDGRRASTGLRRRAGRGRTGEGTSAVRKRRGEPRRTSTEHDSIHNEP